VECIINMNVYVKVDANNIVTAVTYASVALNGDWIDTNIDSFLPVALLPVKGGTYNPVTKKYIPPKPEKYPSFVYLESSNTWVPPIHHPMDGITYEWGEASVSWVKPS